jgi:DNA primase
MSLIPDELIDQVRDAADLVAIVGEHVELKRTGADYRGPCPFHGGTHRNFTVIPKKGLYHCFVCHASGDVFTFFMKRLGMDYPTAVREVARRVGITIPERAGPVGPDPRAPLYAAVAAAADWYARQLAESPDAEPARRYLASRDISPEVAAAQGLGFAPRGTAFLDAMKSLGLQPDVLLAAGLAVKREEGTLGARFWGRLLFPIHDLKGQIVAFGGRVLGDGQPKYLNSPESAIYHKGQVLYHLHAAKQAIRTAERAILVEGYFDVLRVALAGHEEVVAPLGTGLTAEQAELLKRYTGQVILVYDSDEPGLRATFRAGDELLRHGLRVAVATIPEGDDPDTLVRRDGAHGLDLVLKDAIDVLDRKLQILERRGHFSSLPGRRRALDRLLPTLRAAMDPITRELYLSRVAEAAGVRKDVLEREVDARAPVARPAPAAPARELAPLVLPAGAERALLLLLLAGDPWRSRVLEAVDALDIEFPAYRAVFEALEHDAPDRLDETAARAFEALKAEGLGDRRPDDMFQKAVDWMEANRLDRDIAGLKREIPLAPEADKPRLVVELKKLVSLRNTKRPTYHLA